MYSVEQPSSSYLYNPPVRPPAGEQLFPHPHVNFPRGPCHPAWGTVRPSGEPLDPRLGNPTALASCNPHDPHFSMTNERVFFLFFIPLTHVVPWSLYLSNKRNTFVLRSCHGGQYYAMSRLSSNVHMWIDIEGSYQKDSSTIGKHNVPKWKYCQCGERRRWRVSLSLQ